MIITDNAYVFIAIVYFLIAVTYLPAFLLPLLESTNENKEGTMTRKYTIVRYFLGFILYLIIGLLYLILWNSHVGIIYKI